MPSPSRGLRVASFTRPTLAISLAMTVAAEVWLVLASHLSGALGMALAVVAAAGWALVITDPAVERRPRWVATALVLVFAAAVAVPPRGSHDLWSYVMYGRTVVVHHASPYLHSPSDYPHDPFFHLVAAGWRGTKSVYGPLFTALSAGLTKLAGGSELRARLAFQGFALVSIVAILRTIWQETTSVRSVAFVGLHPAVVTAIVNGGHNDGLVGLSILLGVVLIRRRRVTAAGFTVGLGMLVKASTAFGILGIAVWLFFRDRRQSVRFIAVAVLTTAIGYLPAGTASLSTITSSANRTSRASVWDPVSRALPGAVAVAALATVVSFALLGAYRMRAHSEPALAAAMAVAAYLVAGAYVLPWYPVWALPVAALKRRSWVAVLIGAHAAFLVAVYELPRTFAPGSFDAVARAICVTPGGVAVATIFIWFLARRRPESTVVAIAP